MGGWFIGGFLGVLIGNLVSEIVKHYWRKHKGKQLVKMFEASMKQAVEGGNADRQAKTHQTKTQKVKVKRS